MVVKCDLCKKEICKYEMDAGDYSYRLHHLKEHQLKYLCDECAKEIAKQLVESA